MKRRFLLLTIMVLSLMFITGCGKVVESVANSTSSSKEKEIKEEVKKDGDTTAELGDYHILLSGKIIEESNQFVVEGKSNLLPGSRIVGEVVVDDGETIYSDTSELVSEDGSFYMELEHHQYGEAEIIIRFDFANLQEDEIKRHYGEKGQKLEGPFIYKHETYDGILKKAEVKITYDPNSENDLAIKAPDWYELPEDYGDPRVWIEVEDITEDGEYFYIHGRTNILEGSEISVKYKNNRGKTRILPDGSFDIKIDYEYLEDEEIVITFEPASWQWNEIEEAYGQKGQKLVGNLVVQDKYSDNQYIEKRIPWDNKSAQPENNDHSDSELEEESETEHSEEEE